MTKPGGDTQAAALTELRRLRRAPRAEWAAFHYEAMTRARSAGATYAQIDETCADPEDEIPPD